MPVRRVDLGPVGRVVKENVRECRVKRGLTQAQLAEKADLPTQSITEIENGARRVTVDDLVSICGALRVTPNRLLGIKGGVR